MKCVLILDYDDVRGGCESVVLAQAWGLNGLVGCANVLSNTTSNDKWEKPQKELQKPMNMYISSRAFTVHVIDEIHR